MSLLLSQQAPPAALASFLENDSPARAPRLRTATWFVIEAFVVGSTLADALPISEPTTPRAPTRVSRNVEETFSLSPLAPSLRSFLGEEAPSSKARSRSRAFDTFPEKRVLAPFIEDSPPRGKTRQARRTEELDALSELDQNEGTSFLNDEIVSRRQAARARSADAFVESRLDQNEVASFLADERVPHRQGTRSKLVDAFVESRLLLPFLGDERVLGGKRASSKAFDTFPEKAVLAPFIDTDGAVRSILRAPRIEESSVLPELDQNEVVAFLADERGFNPQRSRARAFDNFPEKAMLAPFLDEEGTHTGKRTGARGEFDDLPEKPLLAPFLDVDGEIRVRIRRTAGTEEVDPLSELDQNEVVAFLADERAFAPRRQSAKAFDTFPENAVLAPFIDADGAIRATIHHSRAEETDSLPPLDRNEVAAFLNDEIGHSPLRWRAKAFDVFPERRLFVMPPPRPPKPRRTILQPSRGGGVGDREWRPPVEYQIEIQKVHVYFDEAKPEAEADYALMGITVGATVRALASGLVTHFKDARGRSALKLEADDGTNYYYADLSGYVGAADRRVTAGEAIAKSAREAVPEITRAPQTKELPEKAGEVSAPPKLRTVAPVFVEPPVESSSPAPRMFVRLVPIPTAPSLSMGGEWAVRAPEHRRTPVIAYVAGVGALAALLYALSFMKPKRRK